jgi:selenocysteine lyase/cysteine desulfurase
VPPAPLPPQRHRFDLPDDVAYLNAAYLGPLSIEAAAAGRAGLEAKLHPWSIRPVDFFEPVSELRRLVGELVGVGEDAIAIVPAVSYGAATAAANLTVGEGRTVVVLADQFPSNVYSWRVLAERTGGTVETVGWPADGDWTAAVLAAVDDRTAIVAVPPCHWTDGTVVDLVAVGEAARAVGAAFFVDATQALGAMPVDVAAARPDYLACAMYKWLLGPYSMAFLYVAPERRDGEPIEHSWLARAGSEDFVSLVDYRDDFQPGARRFDGGQVANFALVPAATAAVRMILEWGVDAVAATIAGLTGRVADGAERLGLGVAAPAVRSPHLIGVRLGGAADPRLLGDLLAAEHVHVSIRGDAVRVAPHVYNTEEEVDRLLGVLASAVR